MENLGKQVLALQEYKDKTEKAAIMQDSYNKRLNFLVNGLEEATDTSWETHNQTLDKCNWFFSKALDLDPESIQIIDIQRLPQWPLFRNGGKVNRPIIVKLTLTRLTSRVYVVSLKSCKLSTSNNKKIIPTPV